MKAAPDYHNLAALADPEQHPGALERAAIAALSTGDLTLAYNLADRRCRILPRAQARHYTLRGEIAYRRGFIAEARTDLLKALELAPDDRAANRRMMQWGEGKDRELAARRLISIDHDFDALAAVILALKASDDSGFGAIRRIGDRLAGWVTWKGRTRPCLQIEHDQRSESHFIESDPEHPLARAAEHAASFDVSFAHGPSRSVARLLLGRHEIDHQVSPAPLGRPKAAASPIAPPGGTDHVTIIVPIYDAFDLTERCLQSLMRAVNDDSKATVLLVDDATPDPNIAELLDRLASQPNVQLLRNRHNLGFIGAVNRALRTIAAGDVILLNSDAIVPNDFVSRLMAAAYSASDIGTVTPLSNNGEATSLPRPFTPNPLLDEAEIRLVDSIAARANSGRIIDMPDGIGFCLYIKRACLDAVGGLSEHYHRGYLEDVDLCLRARENGFRNVCAASVYVGHAGSASFKSEKRALVVRNLDRLQLRFPHYRSESAAFKALDPLKVARAAIERGLAADYRDALVVLTGPGAPAEAAVVFAESSSHRVLVATLQRGVLNLRDAGNGFGFPQSLNFALPAKRSALSEAMRNFAFSRVVVADPARIPREVATNLAPNDTPIDLLVTDGGLWCRCGGLDLHRNPCAALVRGKTCGCHGLGRPDDWLMGPKTERIIAPDSIAAAFLRRRLPSSWATQIHLADFADRFRRMRRPSKVASQGTTFGLLAAGRAPADFLLMLQVVRRIRQARPRSQIAIFGETLDDLALMRLGNVTVTGAFAAHELPSLAKNYSLAGLAVARRTPLFGQPIIAAAFCDTDVPLALVDWSFGSTRVAKGDLAIAPASSEDAIVADLLAWSAQW